MVATAGMLLLSVNSAAKPEFTKKEKKPCTYCHTDAKAKPKELTDAGKYYSAHKNSLEGYSEKK